jgi:hypothetical protein
MVILLQEDLIYRNVNLRQIFKEFQSHYCLLIFIDLACVLVFHYDLKSFSLQKDQSCYSQ